MKTRFDPERLNVAPQARQYAPLSWLALTVSAAVAMACAYPLLQSIQELGRARLMQREFNGATKRKVDELHKQKAEQSSPAAQEREKAQMRMQELVRMSWDGIFDALEAAAQAVNGGVSVLLLTPTSVQPSSTQLNITALAANAPIMLAYVDVLKHDSHIRQVELTSQQPDDKPGPGVIRFELSVLWNPSAMDADASRPATPVGPRNPAAQASAPKAAVQGAGPKNLQGSTK